MKKLFLLCFIVLASCQSEEPASSVYFDGGYKIEILDAEGNNMLNPNHANPILLKDLQLIHIIDGERKLYYDSNMDLPKGMIIYLDEYHNKWILGVLHNVYDQNEDLKTTAIVDFGDGTEGVVVAQWNQSTNSPGSGSLFIEKVWYNDELVHEGMDYRIFTITK